MHVITWKSNYKCSLKDQFKMPQKQKNGNVCRACHTTFLDVKALFY